MLICVAGKNNIAVDVIDYLYSRYSPEIEFGVLCNKIDSGKNTFQKSLRLWATLHNVKEYSLEELYDIRNMIFLSMEYEKIIKPSLFKTDKLYNIHFSLLPSYKGMYTSALPILHGEKYTGVTFHCIDDGIDTGDIIDQAKIKINSNDTCRDLYLKYIEEGTKLVISNVDSVISGQYISRPQPSKGATYYSKKVINYNDININMRQTAEQISREIRAYSFREYQLPSYSGKRIITCKITKDKSNNIPGTIINEDDCSITLTTIDYNIVFYYDRFEELMEACKKNDINSVKKICKVKCHINQKDVHGWTPLIVATYYNNKEIVNYLIDHGADYCVKNNNGTNLLMYAKEAFLNYNDLSLVKLYLNKGILATDKDYFGKDLWYYIDQGVIDVEKYSILLEMLRNN